MKRIKFWWMMPWEIQPRLGEYFRVGLCVGRCIFKCPWFIIQAVDRR